MIYPGMGVNYGALQSNWATDKAYFKSIKNHSSPFVIRMNLPSIPIPWAAGTPDPSDSSNAANVTAFWRSCGLYFSTDSDFYVIGGSGAPAATVVGNLTATRWAQYHTSVISEITYLIAQGIALDVYEVGNELEAFIDNSTLTVTQLNANIRQLALDIKAVTGWTALGTKVSYALTMNTVHNDANIDWLSNGLGGLDLITVHPYGLVNVAAQTVAPSSFTLIEEFIDEFGDQCIVSEFNLDPHFDRLAALGAPAAVAAMQSFFNTYILGLNVSKFCAFQWVGYQNGSNKWSQLYMDGSMNPVWFVFFIDNPLLYTPRSTSIVSRSRISRGSSVVSRSIVSRNLVK